ncbi:hypothetical protein LEP1GSC050_0695 [Leptospira broomii serovar Hurstbridge str. 5399]|uniref:Uncharacterized protein n=1 Tax=Leptospira broomii serovar Hurstbridge str. 5399 TaxID=1049789 RepID=T0FGX9_9LEPT|nr:hypothetical protein LEP1GSC050_0695 [Leptospira broomii serovar Hurstbridge str. 5399]
MTESSKMIEFQLELKISTFPRSQLDYYRRESLFEGKFDGSKI